MHDGRIGGGRKGIGRKAFLIWSGVKPVSVETQAGNMRPGILVTQLDERKIAPGIARFVSTVASFKQALTDGDPNILPSHDEESPYGDYFDESPGKRKRRQIDEVEYWSRHGEIVSALERWRRTRAKKRERIVKNQFIDLGVAIDDKLVELYEVKPSCDRSELYKGRGQIFVYSARADEGVEKFLVLPFHEEIPEDIADAIARAQISVLRFEMDETVVTIKA